MTKDEALKKYAEEILENDRLGLGQALKFKMEDDQLVKFAISGLVQEVYALQEKLLEAEGYKKEFEKYLNAFHVELQQKNDLQSKLSYFDQREMEYTKACDSLHEKLRIAVNAFREITENCCMDEGHRMYDVSNEALNKISGE